MSLRPPISGLVCISFVSRCLRNKRDTPYIRVISVPTILDGEVSPKGEAESDKRNGG